MGIASSPRAGGRAPPRGARGWQIVAVVVFLSRVLGCAAQPVNPSFPVTIEEARQDLGRIAANPKPLRRPLLIVGGFMDPGIGLFPLECRFESLFNDRRVIPVSLAFCFSLDGCRERIVEMLDRACPSSESNETIEVDVIGCSLGGLAARYASLPTDGGAGRRLRIARLFAISSPLRGAAQADEFPPLHPLLKDLRTGSAAIARVNACPAPYPIYPYVRLGDGPVGEENAAPPGQTAWWVSTPPLHVAHIGAMTDPRILADIARRLRGETPLTKTPAAPIPDEP